MHRSSSKRTCYQSRDLTESTLLIKIIGAKETEMVEHTAPLNMISWSTEKVGEWLTERGFDDDIKQVFIGENLLYMYI